MSRGRSAVTAVALALLLWAAPTPLSAWASVRHPAAAIDVFAPALAVVALGAWALAGWLLAVTAAVLLGRLPGHVGQTATWTARRIAPAAVRRALTLTLGLTIAGGAVLAPAALAAGPGPVAGTSRSGSSPAPPAGSASPSVLAASSASASPAGSLTIPELDWPMAVPPRTSASTSSRTTPTTAPAVIARPVVPSPGGGASGAGSPSPPSSPAAAPRPTAPPTTTDGGPPGAARVKPGPAALPPRTSSRSVVVRPGDTLWHLSGEHLRQQGITPTTARIAVSWPSWWQANREVIGPDPDLLLPGMHLTIPDAGG